MRAIIRRRAAMAPTTRRRTPVIQGACEDEQGAVVEIDSRGPAAVVGARRADVRFSLAVRVADEPGRTGRLQNHLAGPARRISFAREYSAGEIGDRYGANLAGLCRSGGDLRRAQLEPGSRVG